MYELVSYIIKSVLAATRSNVTVLVTVALQRAIDARKKAKAPEVELAFVH